MAGRTLKSADYRNWIAVAGWDVARSRPGACLHSPCAVEIRLAKPNAASDIDNRTKASLDLLQSAGVIANDNLVHDVRALWDSTVAKGRCIITVTPISRPGTASEAQGRGRSRKRGVPSLSKITSAAGVLGDS